MAAIAWADVTNHAGELAGVAVAAQNDILAHVNTALKVTEFGGESSPKLKLARIYLAAHIATLTTAGGSAQAGPLVSETVDNISRSYASPGSAGGHNWDATPYGGQFRSLVRASPARFPKAF